MSISGTILGLNAAYHQPSACLVKDGVVVAAAEEERFNRWKGGKKADVDYTLLMPFRSIQHVLEAGGVRWCDVERIGTSFSPDLRRQVTELWETHPPILQGGYETPEGDRAFRELMLLMPAVLAGRYDLDVKSVEARFRWVPHHLSHLASAFYASPFEDAAGLVIDGIGEFDTTSLADCDGDGLRILESIDYPHSLGFLWEVITTFLGFQGNHDESKIMGLAAYGDPDKHGDAMREIVHVAADGTFTTQIDPGVLHGDYSALEKLFGVPRRLPYEPLAWQGRSRHHANLAAALQEQTNDIFLRRARRAKELTGRRRLVMAGGVTLNCVANGLVADHGPFDDVYVQPAAGDAGTCVGAALYLAYEGESAARRGAVMPHAFLGPSFDETEIRAALDHHRLPHERLGDPVDTAVRLLADGRVVGWFQGRMEFGPRALGNRSLLANPTLPGIRHVLNLQVKHREEFRPFCPSILAEHASEWLVHDRPLCDASRYMLATYRIRPEKQEHVPAIMHLDGSSRVQVVHREDNPLYHEVIARFHERTKIPMLLNTSFNDREPIVCSPDDACKCYLKTRFDAMVLGPFLVEGPKPWERSPKLSAFDREALKFDAMGRAEETRN